MSAQTITFAALATGFELEHTGGNCQVLRKGRVVLSGYDGDLPDDHWWIVAVYPEPDRWAESEDAIWLMSDGSAEGIGMPFDLAAAIAEAERQAL